MHELGIALAIMDRVIHRAASAKVQSVTIEVGVLTAVLPDALSFAFELAACGTPAEGAELVIRQPPAQATCRACGRFLTLDGPVGRCTCGGIDLDWQSGDELRIVEMELSTCAERVAVPS